jgi:molybdopterin/thiamine biosynthesis adenylyltransferase
MLNDLDLIRYDRQIMLKDFDGRQEKLEKAGS